MTAILRGSIVLTLLLSLQPLATAQIKQPPNPARWFEEETLFFAGSAGLDATQAAMLQTAYGKIFASDWYLKTVERLQFAPFVSGDIAPQYVELYRVATDLLTYAPFGFAVERASLTSEGPDLRVALVIRDKDRATRLVGVLDKILEDLEAPFETRKLEGDIKLRYSKLFDSPFEAGYAQVGDLFVVGAGPSGYAEELVARLQRPNARSLASSVPYQRVLRKLVGSDKPIGSIYLDTPRVIDLVRQALEMSGEQLPVVLRVLLSDSSGLDRIEAMGAAYSIRGRGFRSGLMIPIRGGLAGREPITDADLAWIPRDSLGFCASSCDFEAFFDWALNLCYASAPEYKGKLEVQIQNAEVYLGAPLREVIRSVGKKFIIFENPAHRSLLPSFMAVIKPENADLVERMVRNGVGFLRLLASYQQVDVSIKEHRVGDEKIVYVSTNGYPVPVAPAWCRIDDRIVLSLQRAELEDWLLRRRENLPSILQDDDFRRVSAAVPGSPSSVSYFDFKSIVDFFYPLILPMLQSGASGMEMVAREFGLEVNEFKFDDAVIPSKYELTRDLFGSISISRLDEDGLSFVSYATYPAGQLVAAGILAVAAAAGAVVVPIVQARESAARAAERAQARAREHERLAERMKREQHKEPTFSNQQQAVLIATAFRDYSKGHGGRYPNAWDELELEFDPSGQWVLISGQRYRSDSTQLVVYQSPDGRDRVWTLDAGCVLEELSVRELKRRLGDR